MLCTSTNEISKGILNSLSCRKQFLWYQRLPITQIIKFSLILERQRFTADWKDLKEGGGAETSLESAFKHCNTVSYRRLNCKRTMKHSTQPAMWQHTPQSCRTPANHFATHLNPSFSKWLECDVKNMYILDFSVTESLTKVCLITLKQDILSALN